jgi:hypothetical protein
LPLTCRKVISNVERPLAGFPVFRRLGSRGAVRGVVEYAAARAAPPLSTGVEKIVDKPGRIRPALRIFVESSSEGTP